MKAEEFNYNFKYCGIDVCKERLDVYCENKVKAYPFSKQGVEKLNADFSDTHSKLMLVYESTGYLSKRLRRWTRELAIEQRQVNAKRVRDFANSKGILTKTDSLDAKCIADYADAMHLTPSMALTATQEALNEYFSQQDLLIRTAAKLKIKTHACDHTELQEGIARLIHALEREIADIEERMINLVKSDKKLNGLYHIYLSIKGVGERSAMGLIVLMPELGTLNRKKVASLVGVAPFIQQSGKTRWPSRIEGGRSRIRKLLYLCCISAIKCNEEIRNFYNKLKGNKKPGKQAIVACLRKLVIYINSLTRSYLRDAQMVNQ